MSLTCTEKKESGTYIYIYIYRERERERERGMLFEYCLSAPIQAKDLRLRIVTQMAELDSCKRGGIGKALPTRKGSKMNIHLKLCD